METFWGSSVLEIQDLMEAYDKHELKMMKQDIIVGFAIADAIATRVAYFFSDEKKRKESDIVQPWDAFPAMFREQKRRAEVSRQDGQLARFKTDMAAFADRWNRRNKDGTKDSL